MLSVYRGLVALAGLTCATMCTVGWATADGQPAADFPQVAADAPVAPAPQALPAIEEPPFDSSAVPADDYTAADVQTASEQVAWTPKPQPQPEVVVPEPRVARRASVATAAKSAKQTKSTAACNRRVKRVYRVTAYCDQGTTASGRPSGVGQCAAPSNIPFGAKVHIPALKRTFVVTDRTNKRFRHNTVDIFMNTEWACKQFGRNYLECEVTLPAKGR
jgi:3D (Asp-Asp-Asp) domain-containing protein